MSRMRFFLALCTQLLLQCKSYTPPTPKCKPFTCPAGQKPLRKKGHKPWSYGCPKAGDSVFAMSGRNFDPNDPLGSLNQGKKDFDKCCVEHDACQQTCGMSSEDCHNAFNKCATKLCKGDQNCMFQAQIGQMMSAPTFGDEKTDYDFKANDPLCKGYDRWQGDACECVEKDQFEKSNDQRLKTFYKLHNPEKLDEKGDIKDLADVKKKWKGKEPQMFLALTMKYKDKAIERREKPKPPPYTPPPPKDGQKSEEGAGSDLEDSAAADPAEAEDVERFNKIQSLKAEKEDAVAQEDFEKAQQIKDQLDSLTKEEVSRLKKAKDEAVAAEDFLKAKELKGKIEVLQGKTEL